MATLSHPSQARDTRVTALRTGAIASAIVSGTYALVALAIGTPLEFGVALALCGASWIAADYLERTVQRARTIRRRNGLAPRFIALGSPMTCESRVPAATASPPGWPSPPTLVAGSVR